MRKYLVRLTDEERKTCEATVDGFKGSSHKERRARILLQATPTGRARPTGKWANPFSAKSR